MCSSLFKVGSKTNLHGPRVCKKLYCSCETHCVVKGKCANKVFQFSTPNIYIILILIKDTTGYQWSMYCIRLIFFTFQMSMFY